MLINLIFGGGGGGEEAQEGQPIYPKRPRMLQPQAGHWDHKKSLLVGNRENPAWPKYATRFPALRTTSEMRFLWHCLCTLDHSAAQECGILRSDRLMSIAFLYLTSQAHGYWTEITNKSPRKYKTTQA